MLARYLAGRILNLIQGLLTKILTNRRLVVYIIFIFSAINEIFEKADISGNGKISLQVRRKESQVEFRNKVRI